MSLVEQYALVKNATVDKVKTCLTARFTTCPPASDFVRVACYLIVFSRLLPVKQDFFDHACALLPAGPLRTACDTFFLVFGGDIIKLLEEKATPDVVCTAIKLCSGQCHLFPEPKGGLAAAVAQAHKISRVEHLLRRDLPAICNIPGIKELCELIYNFANNHDPLDDLDGDRYSPMATLRGADWRGKDCDDKSKDVHPGRMPVNGDAESDTNCNGIYGVDPVSNKPYEDIFCSGTGAMGTVVLGDSASAHFHVPPQLFEPAGYDQQTFANLFYMLENEFDWPMLSASTAFYPNTSRFEPDISGLVNSTYMILRQRNRCNANDYQNIAVNGARVGSMNSSIIRSLARQQTDKAVLAIYALIGNGKPFCDVLMHERVTLSAPTNRCLQWPRRHASPHDHA